MEITLLSVSDLCEELHIGKTTAYKLIRSGALPYSKIGRKILVRRADLETFISETIQTTSE